MKIKFAAQSGLAALRAVAEETRLRVLLLLRTSELTVKDLGWVLGQSQPRISRHLKLLHEAELIDRHREGSWVYFRLSEREPGRSLVRSILETFDDNDVMVRLDLDRLSQLAEERTAEAQRYFNKNASNWDRLRSLHVDEEQVEALLSELFGMQPVERLVDLGTGTGRMLELLHGRYVQGIGIDANQAMLNYARSRLEARCGGCTQVRQGDINRLSLDDSSADAVIMHQVLHHLRDPVAGLREAARILAPQGRLFVIDFAPHELEFLRAEYAHERLGFSAPQMAHWFETVGLQQTRLEKLEPRVSSDTKLLTVSIWVGERKAAGSNGGTAYTQQNEIWRSSNEREIRYHTPQPPDRHR